MQLSVAAANARLDQIETVINGPVFRFFTGVPPADCAAADTGTLLCEAYGVPNWLDDASDGTKGLRAGVAISNYPMEPGIVGHFRICDGGNVCHVQGTCSVPGGDGDMILSNTNVVPDQELRVLAVTITDNTL